MSFRWTSMVACGVALGWGAQAQASSAPSYAPPPGWVDVAPTPDAAVADGSPALQVLLDDNQSRLGPTGASFYNRRVVKVLKPEGLTDLTTENFTWSPDTEDLTIHAIVIRRDGKVIDLLKGGRNILVLRRETGLELGMLDGRLTATQQIAGLQVGDVLDASWTQTRHDPVMAGHSEDPEGFSSASPIARYRLHVSWPSSYPVRWRTGLGFGDPQVSTRGDRTELVLDKAQAKAPDPPLGAPPRYFWLGRFEASSFRSWEEASSLISPLFARASTLNPASPIKAEAAAIASSSTDPKVRAFAALKLVEDKVRYFFIGTDDGGYVPADADLTWQRRFGDCKGKTVLLLSLLKELGVQAEPALVSTSDGDELQDALPGVQHFNHVIVRAQIGGKVYWLDGTRSGDIGGVDALSPPAWRWALPLTSQGSALERIVQPPLDQPQMAIAMRVDASKGVEAPAPTEIQMVMHGDMAIAMRISAAMSSKEDLQKTALRSFARSLSWVDITSMDWRDDPKANSFEMDFKGTADMDWRENDDLHQKEFVLQGASSTGSAIFPRRIGGAEPDAPFAVAYPMYVSSRIEVALPRGGAGFSVRGANVDQPFGAYQITRSAALDGGVARFLGSIKSLAPETTVSAAEAANKDIRRLAEVQDLIRWADAPAPTADAGPAPKPGQLASSAGR